MPSYQILRLDDAKMSIKAHLKIGRGATWNIIKHRSQFLSLIGFNTFTIVVYNYRDGGSIPTAVYVFNIETENTIYTDTVKEKLPSPYGCLQSMLHLKLPRTLLLQFIKVHIDPSCLVIPKCPP